MTYRTVAAAEAVMTGASKGQWLLADAVLADVPELPEGRQPGSHDPSYRTVRDKLTDVAMALEEAGITTPNGDAYSVDSLVSLRKTAIAWPEQERHPEAAYRTHQEIGAPQRRAVLDALCRHANGERVDNPAPTWVDDDAFDSACQMVEAQVAKGKGYAVSANAVRVAMSRKPNVNKPPSTVFEMVRKMHDVGSDVKGFRKLLHENGVGLSDEEKLSLREGVRTLIQLLTDILDEVTGLTDDDVTALLGVEENG